MKSISPLHGHPAGGMSVVTFLLALVLTGCPGGPSKSPSSQLAQSRDAALTFTDEAAVLKADASIAPIQSALANLALDSSQRATLRYAALRKLEEQAPSVALPLADRFASDTTRSKDADFLRENAVGVLVRSKEPVAKAALERLTKTSIEIGILVARLSRKEGE
jgi:hypothetical protein